MNKIIKEFPRAIVIGFIIFIFILSVNFLNGNQINYNTIKWTGFYSVIYTLSLHLSNTLLFIKLDEIFKNERFTKKRIVIGFIASFILSLFVIFLLRIFEEVIIENSSLESFLKNESPKNYIFSSLITFIVLLIIHFIYLYKYYQESRLKEQKIIAGTANAQFESLKNQIDPHFLFNSLNVLSSLIEENPENAQQFTISLSKIYRYVLEQKDKELVTVQEELAFAKTYMNLLKMRFENSITFELPGSLDNTDFKVVPLSLQLLLENTIKHNVVSENKPLHIKIFIKENFLVVENNLQKKDILNDRKGVGLQNIVSRYAILTERTVLIDENKNSFSVYLPILTQQINSMKTSNAFNENTAYIRAKERVEKLKGFYGNLLAYCFVIPILIIINLNSNSTFQWFWFPMLGWGMGLTFHAFETFGYGKSWEEKKIQEIVNKQNNLNNKWK